ncbi:hypothetical protein [Streptomyces scabiei]|uniref:hypothetical protein n=1 Tax=Streptomyces scabiei TaxID=1930 RepID=UPI0029A25F79|nr:hypothetical protein [Streptomyces scabiei]MDX3118581.1 hypothetical protein [Streptomyces scabiei]
MTPPEAEEVDLPSGNKAFVALMGYVPSNPYGDEENGLFQEFTKNPFGEHPGVIVSAVCVDPVEQWVAMAPRDPVSPQTLGRGFGIILTCAANRKDISQYSWEVNAVCTKLDLASWIDAHPHVSSVEFTLRYPNPMRDVENVLKEMQELGAQESRRVFIAPHEKSLKRLDPEFIQRIEEAVRKGQADFLLVSQVASGEAHLDSKLMQDTEELPTASEQDQAEILRHLTRALRDWEQQNLRITA